MASQQLESTARGKREITYVDSSTGRPHFHKKSKNPQQYGAGTYLPMQWQMKCVDVIIETPRGSAEKYAYDKDLHLFKLKKILPSGMVFPYDFGFIPKTNGEDGDPIDVLVICEHKSFTGCIMKCRIIGALLAEQTSKKKTIRNDRFFAVPILSKTFKNLRSINEISDEEMTDLVNFFIVYNAIAGKKFKPVGVLPPEEARRFLNGNFLAPH